MPRHDRALPAGRRTCCPRAARGGLAKAVPGPSDPRLKKTTGCARLKEPGPGMRTSAFLVLGAVLSLGDAALAYLAPSSFVRPPAASSLRVRSVVPRAQPILRYTVLNPPANQGRCTGGASKVSLWHRASTYRLSVCASRRHTLARASEECSEAAHRSLCLPLWRCGADRARRVLAHRTARGRAAPRWLAQEDVKPEDRKYKVGDPCEAEWIGDNGWCRARATPRARRPRRGGSATRRRMRSGLAARRH
jgi:hypothetical protein